MLKFVALLKLKMVLIVHTLWMLIVRGQRGFQKDGKLVSDIMGTNMGGLWYKT